MADIHERILKRYDIDVEQENIFKLYKIESADLSRQEIQTAIEATRKRWNQSINGANEKIAERDRNRLDKADKYEAILSDEKLRKELFRYYSGGGKKSKGKGSSSPVGGQEFAREYFNLLKTSKKIKSQDVDFFFEYYQAERKNKKAILDMLKSDFKVAGLDKKDDTDKPDVDDEPEGKRKDENSPLIVNLFQEATVLRLRKCLDNLEKAIQSNDVCQKYPALRDGLYEFLGLNSIDDINVFKEMILSKSKEVYSVRQERGSDFVPLVDILNTLKTLSEYRDVVDNYPEFKLLIKYPTLTPYMFAFTEMKPDTMKGIIDIANKEYSFRDDVDFILNYYNPVHDNFGITNSGIGNLLKKAEKKAKANEVLNRIDEKLNRSKTKRLSIAVEIVHWLVYFPIFIVYLLFEVFKAISTELHRFILPLFILSFVAANWLFPKISHVENLLYLRKIFIKEEWYEYLKRVTGGTIENGFEAVILSLIALIITIMVYLLPPIFVAYFTLETTTEINKRYDWNGYERTFQQIFQILNNKKEADYKKQPDLYFTQRIPKIIINLVCIILLALLIYLAPTGFRLFSEKTGYFQENKKVSEETTERRQSPF